MSIDTMKSIDALMDELRLVINIAPEDKIDLLSYCLADLQGVFQEDWHDVL